MQLAIIGYGELGKQIHALIIQTHTAKDVIFFDDEYCKEANSGAYPFAGFEKDVYKDYEFVVALGYKHPKVKQQVLEKLNRLGRKIFSFVHPSCFVNPTARVGEGTIVYPMCNIDKEVKVGRSVLINNSVTLSHNCIIGDCSYISPGVILSGKVAVGENTFIGAGTTVANRVSIGSNVIVGIGTVVTKDVPDNCFVIGNPMRFVNKLDLV